MTLSDLDSLLCDIRGTRVAVLGDIALDACWFLDGSHAEQSVETGLTTRPVRRARNTPGGAANVAANLSALGAHVRVFSAFGDDPFGWELRRLLRAAGVETADALVPRGWATQTYIKPHEDGVEQPRYDFGNYNHLDDDDGRALLLRLEAALPEVDLVVVNQQAFAGLHTPAFRAGLGDLIARRTDTLFLADTRHAEAFCPGAAQKMTVFEAARICGLSAEPDTEETARAVAEVLCARCRGPVVLTRNSHGCLVRDGDGACVVPAVRVEGPVDATGAGDVFLAGLGAAMAAGRSAREGAALGALAAAVTVQKLQEAGIATAAEVRALATSRL